MLSSASLKSTPGSIWVIYNVDKLTWKMILDYVTIFTVWWRMVHNLTRLSCGAIWNQFSCHNATEIGFTLKYILTFCHRFTILFTKHLLKWHAKWQQDQSHTYDRSICTVTLKQHFSLNKVNEFGVKWSDPISMTR